MCLLLEASLVQSRGQIQYILGVTDWYHQRWWPSTSITHFTLSWFQRGDISSKSYEIHLRVLKKVKTDLFPAVVSIVSMILPCENRNIADQISSYLLFLPIHSQKNNWKKFLQKVMLVASNSGWGELFDGRWLCFWVVFRAGCNCPVFCSCCVGIIARGSKQCIWMLPRALMHLMSSFGLVLSFHRLRWFSHLARSAVRPTFSSWRRRSDRRESKNRELKDFQKSKVSEKKNEKKLRVSEFPWLLMIHRDIWHMLQGRKEMKWKSCGTIFVFDTFYVPWKGWFHRACFEAFLSSVAQSRSFWVSRSCRRFQKPVAKINTASWLNVLNIATLLRCFHTKKWHL